MTMYLLVNLCDF